MKECVLYLLYYDFFYYFMHRLLHTKYLYPIHKIHHKKYNTNYYDYYSVSILEIPISSLGLFIAIYLYKLYIYQLFICILFINIRGTLQHDSKFTFLVGEHHLLHHKFIKFNYGEPWLDYIFRTQYEKKILSN